MTMAIAMWIAVLFFSSWLSAQTKRRIVGMGLLADITVHAVLQLMSAATQKAAPACCSPASSSTSPCTHTAGCSVTRS